jgi:hypothetical protein
MAYHPSQIWLAMQSLHPKLVLNVDYELALIEGAPQISGWKRSDVAQPTQAEIEAVDTDALLRSQSTFLARNLLAQLTADDYARIQTAIGSSPALGLLWSSLLGQGEAPISASSDRFKQGWAGMTLVLGNQRAQTIAAAVGIPG